ncbi:MAG: DUF624 domain-containing protein [Oscillospiraceae bacterium]|nr:DUF624 domain-containing protein [Oscillospiraceae bacterium]
MADFFGYFGAQMKAGPGIGKNEPEKKRFFLFWELFFRKVWQLMVLNLLFVAACVPIVTIGPAIAAFSYVLRNYAWGKPVFLFSDFMDAFKKNFRQALCMSLINAVFIILFNYALDYYLEQLSGGILYVAAFTVAIFMMFVFVFANFYTFLMITSAQLSLKQIIKNSVLLSFLAVKTNFITLFFIIVTFFTLAFITIAVNNYLIMSLMILLMVLIIPAFIGFIVTFNSFQYILKYVAQENLDDQDESEEDISAVFKDMGATEEDTDG